MDDFQEVMQSAHYRLITQDEWDTALAEEFTVRSLGMQSTLAWAAAGDLITTRVLLLYAQGGRQLWLVNSYGGDSHCACSGQ